MARPKVTDPVEGRTLHLRRSRWVALDAECRRRGMRTAELVDRLLERAGIGGDPSPEEMARPVLVERAEDTGRDVVVPSGSVEEFDRQVRAIESDVEQAMVRRAADLHRAPDDLDATLPCGHRRVFATGGRCRMCGEPA